MVDANLIITAPKMKDSIKDILSVLDGNGTLNMTWIKNRLLEAI
jgi:hypothetical protein